MKADIHIVGAGPAGATLAYHLSKKGYTVHVYEAAHKPGMKPCGRAIPGVEGIGVNIPENCIQRPLRGAKLYVDGEEVFDLHGLNGYIIDRTCMFQALINESGAEVFYRSRYDPNTSTVRVNGSDKITIPSSAILVNAGGHAFYPGEKINAIQYIYETSILDEQDTIEVYFDTKLIGYYWVFPSTPGYAEVGVGGYADFNTLRVLLEKFTSRDPRFRDKTLSKIEGARIAVGGIKINKYNGSITIGEAAGFVLPLTGEGIRPSMLSALSLADAIEKGKNPVKALEKSKIAESIMIQRRILEGVKKLSVPERRELLRNIPGDLHASIALGNISKMSITKALVSKPKIAKMLIKMAFS